VRRDTSGHPSIDSAREEGLSQGFEEQQKAQPGLKEPAVIQRAGMQRHAPAGVWAAVWFAVLARGWVIFKSTC